MKLSCRGMMMLAMLWPAPAGLAQVRLTGKVWIPRSRRAEDHLPDNTGIPEDYFAADHPGSPPGLMPLAGIRCLASLEGPQQQAVGSITWSTAPSGWYTLSGSSGRYTLLFTGPSAFIRPLIFTNVYTYPGETIDRKVIPPTWYGMFGQREWDEKAASAYYQMFVAEGTSVTNVGFKLVHDGIDGIGPGSQNVLVSVHKKGPGRPDTWERIGPAVPVLQVDCGGPKDYAWSAAWNSGEVPTIPGQQYAVRLAPEQPDGKFQAFWQKNDRPTEDCYRVRREGPTGFVGRSLWMYVAGDGDGLLIPYNKHIQKEYGQFGGFAKRWSQTYVAMGRSPASVIVYAAFSGTQPGISRQRVVIRIREGGPSGPVIGTEKTAIGLGIHTGDASWGVFGTTYAPGEVVLEPGKTYAVDCESVENQASLAGYVNIKGVASDCKPGFNPYRQNPAESYRQGTAYKNGTEDAGFDLDMQIVEYQNEAGDWSRAVIPENRLVNGDLEVQPATGEDGTPTPEQGWSFVPLVQGTVCQIVESGPDDQNRLARIAAGAADQQKVDGYLVQCINGLTRLDTYRLSGHVRCSWALDYEHACQVGIDPTGQTCDPEAHTIDWRNLPPIHSVFVDYCSEPIRTKAGSISVWLRAKAASSGGYPFRADFDQFALQRVDTGVPGIR